MSIGNDPGARKHKAKDIRKTSSPGKVYASRASKPSGVVAIGSTDNLTELVPAASSISASTGTYSNGAEPTGTEIDTAIDEATAKLDTALDLKSDNVDVETLRTEVEARLDVIEVKVDAILAALKK